MPQNCLMDNGTTDHLTSNLDNLVIHSEYHGPEEVTLGNGSKFPIPHISKGSIFISSKSYVLDDLLHVPTTIQNLISISSHFYQKLTIY